MGFDLVAIAARVIQHIVTWKDIKTNILISNSLDVIYVDIEIIEKIEFDCTW